MSIKRQLVKTAVGVFFAFASIIINLVHLLCNWTEQNKYKQQVIDQIQELTQKEVKEVGGKSEAICKKCLNTNSYLDTE